MGDKHTQPCQPPLALDHVSTKNNSRQHHAAVVALFHSPMGILFRLDLQ